MDIHAICTCTHTKYAVRRHTCTYKHTLLPELICLPSFFPWKHLDKGRDVYPAFNGCQGYQIWKSQGIKLDFAKEFVGNFGMALLFRYSHFKKKKKKRQEENRLDVTSLFCGEWDTQRVPSVHCYPCTLGLWGSSEPGFLQSTHRTLQLIQDPPPCRASGHVLGHF